MIARRALRAAAVLAVSLAAGAAPALDLPHGVAPGDRVLLIGIDQYKDPRNNLPPNSSTKDSRDIGRLAVQHLGYREDQVLMLLNEQATRANILGAIDQWLAAGSKPGARVLLQYSGHGYHIDDTSGDESDGQDEVLVPWDVSPADVRGTVVVDDEIEARLGRLKDRDVLVIIDACHSGTVTRDLALGDDDDREVMRLARFDDPAASRGVSLGGGDRGGGDAVLNARARESSFIKRDGNMRVWSAVSATEVALVDTVANPKQGVFTRRLVEAVADGRADANRNGVVSNAEVLNYVRDASDAYCRSSPACAPKKRSLTPTLESSAVALGADFRSGKTAPDTAGAVTDAMGQGAQGSGGATVGSAQSPATSAPPGPLRIRVLPGEEVRLGQEVVFEVASPVTGHLVVLDIAADGKVTQIFPNEFSQKAGNRITTARPIRLPEPHYGFAFEAQPPTGQGTLMAVVASQAVDLSDIAPAARGFGAVERPVVMAGEIAQRLAKALDNRLSGQGVQWSYATRAYTISP